jgi:hypothetical protein
METIESEVAAALEGVEWTSQEFSQTHLRRWLRFCHATWNDAFS